MYTCICPFFPSFPSLKHTKSIQPNTKRKKNPRFASYCPYCQIASNPLNPLPLGGLREPPSYDFATSKASSPSSRHTGGNGPPPYTTTAAAPSLDNEKHTNTNSSPTTPGQQDAIHFLAPDDTLLSLSLRYGIPAQHLRAHNRLPAGADHLLAARRTLRIPPSPGPGQSSSAVVVSLSPQPVEGEAEVERKARIRRWMVACKCADYEVAELYLAQSGGEVDAAVERFVADGEWERRNPLQVGGKGKGRGGVWASQAAFWRRGA